MPVETIIDTSRNIIIRTATGLLTLEEAQQAFVSLLSHPDFKQDMHVIWDMNEADISHLTSDQFMTMIEFIQHHTDSRGDNYKIALIASSDLTYGMSRMFESHGYKLPVSIRVFRELAQAYSWIEGK